MNTVSYGVYAAKPNRLANKQKLITIISRYLYFFFIEPQLGKLGIYFYFLITHLNLPKP